MPSLSRRRCLKTLAGALAAPACIPCVAAKPSAEEERTIAGLAARYLKESGAPSLSVAFASQGRLAYSAAFGMADAAKGEKATTAHRFRIASVSKPFTSTAIYTLIEQGRLKLADKVFTDVLGMDVSRAASRTVADITLHHLLTHTCGGWSNKGEDPMFQHLEMNHAELIGTTLRTHALEHAPGTHYAYSNFGYCVLGRVIEKVTGKPYADYVQQNVLTPCGISTMRIGGNTLAERAENEVAYTGQNGQNPYIMNVRRMDSHGGWIARPEDLVNFLLHMDGFDNPKDLLRPATLKTMLTPTAAGPGYASGFAINKAPNWWHLGSLPGTNAIAVRTAGGLCWAGITNSRGTDTDLALDKLMWRIARSVPTWKA